MGEAAPPLLGELKYNKFQYQGFDKEFCGIWCLAWLYSKQKNIPELMQGFTDLNDDTFE